MYLESLALFILLMVVALRPLLSETYDSSLSAIARIVEDRGHLTPAATAWFNFFIWLAALLTVVAGVIRRRRWRWTGAELGGAVLLAAAVVSSLAAGNKRLAINACGDWLTVIVLFMTLVQLCRCRTRMVLVLAVVVASGTASVARSVMQVAVEYEETSEVYWESKESFWAQQGIPLDDPRVELYERRLAAREATGFLPYSNAQGALLMLAGFAALALSRLYRGPRDRRMVPILLALVLLATIWITGSKGAIGAVVLMFLLWCGSGLLKRDLRSHWRAVWLGGWVAGVVFVLSVAGYGWARGGLPGASLDFRWHYWTVTTRILADHPWTGTGALNFDRAYPAYKPVIYPEEITDPHNFLISAVAQGGPAAGVGLLLLMGGVSWVAARRWGMTDPSRPVVNVESPDESRAVKKWIIAVLGGFFVLRLWLLRGFLDDHAGGLAYVYFEMGSYGLLWMVTAGVLIRLAYREGEPGMKTYRLPLFFGGLAFLLQNMIDFSFFIPGSLTVFAAMIALLLVEEGERPVSAGERFGLVAPPVAVGAGLLLFLVAVFIPVTRTNRLLEQARRSPAAQAEKLYLAATQADPLDPTPWVERARLQALGQDYRSIGRALETLEHAIARDPKNSSLYRLRAELYAFRYRHAGGPNADLMRAVSAGQKLVDLYPESPDKHVFLADLLAKAVIDLAREDLRDRAIGHYREALRLDAERPAHEIRRWSAQRREEVRNSLTALQDGPSM